MSRAFNRLEVNLVPKNLQHIHFNYGALKERIETLKEGLSDSRLAIETAKLEHGDASEVAIRGGANDSTVRVGTPQKRQLPAPITVHSPLYGQTQIKQGGGISKYVTSVISYVDREALAIGHVRPQTSASTSSAVSGSGSGPGPASRGSSRPSSRGSSGSQLAALSNLLVPSSSSSSSSLSSLSSTKASSSSTTSSSTSSSSLSSLSLQSPSLSLPSGAHGFNQVSISELEYPWSKRGQTSGARGGVRRRRRGRGNRTEDIAARKLKQELYVEQVLEEEMHDVWKNRIRQRKVREIIKLHTSLPMSSLEKAKIERKKKAGLSARLGPGTYDDRTKCMSVKDPVRLKNKE